MNRRILGEYIGRNRDLLNEDKLPLREKGALVGVEQGDILGISVQLLKELKRNIYNERIKHQLSIVLNEHELYKTYAKGHRLLDRLLSIKQLQEIFVYHDINLNSRKAAGEVAQLKRLIEPVYSSDETNSSRSAYSGVDLLDRSKEEVAEISFEKGKMYIDVYGENTTDGYQVTLRMKTEKWIQLVREYTNCDQLDEVLHLCM